MRTITKNKRRKRQKKTIVTLWMTLSHQNQTTIPLVPRSESDPQNPLLPENGPISHRPSPSPK
ncbi:hypothetical protein LB505_003052 [Fusarium chuoi]|nr:hypothetical protein LB505_003052 [Fusarium chuoi]